MAPIVGFAALAASPLSLLHHGESAGVGAVEHSKYVFVVCLVKRYHYCFHCLLLGYVGFVFLSLFGRDLRVAGSFFVVGNELHLLLFVFLPIGIEFTLLAQLPALVAYTHTSEYTEH